MANELAIRVKVNLDTKISELDKQLDSVKQHYQKNPIKLDFGLNQNNTKKNINDALKSMINNSQLSIPEITLKFKVNNKEVATQIKAALKSVDIESTTKETSKGIDKSLREQINNLLDIRKKINSLQSQQTGLSVDSNVYKELQRQINAAQEEYNNLRTTISSKLNTENLQELVRQEENLNKVLADKNALEVAKQRDKALQDSGPVYDSIATKIERLNKVVEDYQSKIGTYSGVGGIDTSYAEELIGRFNTYNTDTSLPKEEQYRALSDTITSLRTEMNKLGNEYLNLTKRQTAASTGAKNLATQIQTFLNNTPRIKENTNLYSEFLNLLNRLDSIDVKDPLALPEMTKKFAALRNEVVDLGLTADGTYQKLSNLFSEHFQTALVMAGIHGIQQGLQMVISNVSELDSSMVELKKVTDETEQTYNNFLDGASDKARELGTSIADYTNSVAEWAQAGYTFEEADTLAYVATMYKNVGDGINSAADASEYLISILAGFNLQADQAMSVIDKINEVSNRTAVSAQGLGEILTRSAASLSAAGNTLDESLALAAGANRVIQNSERVGNALRSISLFLRAAKTEAEDLNIDTEGMASSVSELREDVEAIAGVDIMANADGTQFKSTIDILRELAGVWDDLSDIDQANLTEMLAGKHTCQIVQKCA